MNKRIVNLFTNIFYDIFVTVLSTILTFSVFENQYETYELPKIFFIALLPIVTVFFLYVFKIYYVLWASSGFFESVKIAIALFLSIFTAEIANVAVFRSKFHLDIPILIINYFFILILILVQRFGLKYFITYKNASGKKSQISGNVMIIGAGNAGQALIKELSYHKEIKVPCIIDDDKSLYGQYCYGALVVGGKEKIIQAAEKYKIDSIIFAIPTCPYEKRVEILNICQATNCELKILPPLYELHDVNEFKSQIRNVEIEDLLGRPPIRIDVEKVAAYLKDKVVLVTGGGGTIGSELCRQIASQKPKQLIIFDVYENNAYEIQNELKYDFPELNLVTLIGSVRDSRRMDYLFRTYKPQIVYHAAAHKHVPLMEDSPNESIKNNVFGTYKTVQCAHKYGAEKFVLISTDKAVNPTNIMGASKRICEMIVQSYNNRSNTEFVAVRFGNVLGSNGSVIPVFKKQIEHGGPVTVTHPNIIRYFMTVPEAVSLVLQAGASAKGGEIFVLDMGEPVKILDLAENLIRLSGFTPYKDIQIEFTGLRPGEKLYEELLMSEEGLKQTENELIHIGRPISFDEDELFETLDIMASQMYNEEANILLLVKKIVPTYQIPLNKQ